MISSHQIPHKQHLQWLRGLDFRTSIGRRFKSKIGLTSVQCRKLLKPGLIKDCSPHHLKTIINFIQQEYPARELQREKKDIAIKTDTEKSEMYPLRSPLGSPQLLDQATKIQKWYRGYRMRNLVYIHGKGILNRHCCVNDCDFYTLEKLIDIPIPYFFSFYENRLLYGCDIRSLLMLIPANTTNPSSDKTNFPNNPYTRVPLDIKTLRSAYTLIKYLTGCEYSLQYQETTLTPQQQEQQRVLKLFQTIDSLDNYTSVDWFWNMSKSSLKRWYTEVEDIWNYRAQLTNQTRAKIIPPHGIAFSNPVIVIKAINNLESLREIVLREMERLVYSGIDRQHQILGAMYVLTGIVMVDYSAAQALPWLVQ